MLGGEKRGVLIDILFCGLIFKGVCLRAGEGQRLCRYILGRGMGFTFCLETFGGDGYIVLNKDVTNLIKDGLKREEKPIWSLIPCKKKN